MLDVALLFILGAERVRELRESRTLCCWWD
jgi:hypothetical protein